MWKPIETAPSEGEPFIVGRYNHRNQWCSDIWAPETLTREHERMKSGFYKNSPHLCFDPTH